ncbi:MAG: RHS domain-containing protein, partial [Desulfobacteraceae bacterium]|nr:RHS domain-containing protein [Desulfobacteraceae bacterium]
RYHGVAPELEKEKPVVALLSALPGLWVDDAHAQGGNEVLYFFINDDLGTPQKVVDEAGVVVWDADFRPFGEVDVNTSSYDNRFRFAGQYFDQETGLHYNYFRDYNPGIGRYLTPDPLDLSQIHMVRQSLLANALPTLSAASVVGEVQRFLMSDLLYRYSLMQPQAMGLYTYCLNNPINFVDPLGLKWSIGSSFGLLIADYGWDTSAPGKGTLSMPIGQLGGAGWHINWTSNTKTPAESGEAITAPLIWNVGLGKYLGISVADDLSSFSFNIGLGLGLPVSATLPLEGDASFGGWLHDILQPSDGTCK